MAPKPGRILIADADAQAAEELAAWFEDRGDEVVRVEDGHAAWRKLSAKAWFDVVVLSGLLHGISGFEICRRLKQGGGTSGRVVLILDAQDSFTRGIARSVGADASIERGEELAGVEDLLSTGYQRPDVDALLEEREAAVEEGRLKLDPSFSLTAESGGFVDVLTDPDTGLFNRMYVLVKLGEEFRKSRRYGHPLTCLLVGLDGYEDIEREEGREAAEDVISQVAGIVLCGSRDIDVASRVGSSTLLFLLPNTGDAGARTMAARIFGEIEEREFSHPVIARAGLVTVPHDDVETPEDLVRLAERRLNEAFESDRDLVGEPENARA